MFANFSLVGCQSFGSTGHFLKTISSKPVQSNTYPMITYNPICVERHQSTLFLDLSKLSIIQSHSGSSLHLILINDSNIFSSLGSVVQRGSTSRRVDEKWSEQSIGARTCGTTDSDGKTIGSFSISISFSEENPTMPCSCCKPNWVSCNSHSGPYYTYTEFI